MHSTAPMKRADSVLVEMRRHRAVTPSKRPVHPGLTQREAGLTAEDAALLVKGVCRDVADETERGERWANRVLAVLVVVLLILLAVRPFGAARGWWG